MEATSGSAEKEYEKNKELNKEDVKYLFEWMSKQPHLPKISEFQVILFLHSCYYKLEATKTCIDNFYTVRTHCPEFFSKRDPKTNCKDALDLIIYRPLENLTPDGYKVIYCRLLQTDVDKYHFPTQIKAFDMSSMLMLHLEGTHKGLVVITDMKGATFAHMTKLSPVFLKKFFFYLQDAMPVRMKGLHFINIPSWMDKLMALIKPFMKKELMQVVQLHTDNLETLYKFVPQSCLPKDYGGNEETYVELAKKQKNLLVEHADYFVEEEKLLVNESRRPGKPKNEGDVFGMEGTFKKLNID